MTQSAAPETELHAERDGTILILTLDGARTRNSIGPPIYRSIQAQVIEAAEDPGVRAIVLTGAHGFFTSGGNIDNLRKSAQSTMAEVSANTDALNAMILAIRACPVPVIAAVEGGAAGAGVSLALACDMIVAAEAAAFTVSYARVGLAPDGGVTHFLTAGLPRQIATEMCLTADPTPVERLHALGVVNRLVTAGEARAAAMNLAGRLAGGAASAMATIKSEIAAAAHNDLATQLALEARGINRARFGPEAAEGLAAFLEKRKPDFEGKG